LKLTITFRSCFILRFLLNFSVDDCARLLHLDIRQVNARTCAAIARLAEEEKQNHGSAAIQQIV
jgi:DNA-directed RNA polymerase specialized sigma24 family protein